MNKTMKQLERLIKTYRVEELAVKLGVSSSAIWKWKSGRTKPSRLAKERILSLTSIKREVK